MNTMRMFGAAVVLVAMTAIGCGSLEVDMAKVVPAPERADEAIEVVSQFYGLHGRPTVFWYGGRGIDCLTQGGQRGFTGQAGNCVGGEQQDGTIILSDLGGDAQISWTSLSHELGHFASDERGEGGDEAHRDHFFRDPGDDLSLPPAYGHGDAGAANRLLAAVGM